MYFMSVIGVTAANLPTEASEQCMKDGSLLKLVIIRRILVTVYEH